VTVSSGTREFATRRRPPGPNLMACLSFLTTWEIREALINCEILENYPKDPKGPSCLVFGYAMGRPVHVVCGRAKNDWLLIITVYIPKPPKWIDPKTRGGHEK